MSASPGVTLSGAPRAVDVAPGAAECVYLRLDILYLFIYFMGLSKYWIKLSSVVCFNLIVCNLSP